MGVFAMINDFTDYLTRVSDVLEQHATKYEVMARLINLRGKLLGQEFDTTDDLLQMAKQLREHSGYIKDVIDEPHLLIKQ